MRTKSPGFQTHPKLMIINTVASASVADAVIQKGPPTAVERPFC